MRRIAVLFSTLALLGLMALPANGQTTVLGDVSMEVSPATVPTPDQIGNYRPVDMGHFGDRVWNLYPDGAACDLTLSATVDLSDMNRSYTTSAWSEFGIRDTTTPLSGSAYLDFNPGPNKGVWLATSYVSPPVGMEDNLILQRRPGEEGAFWFDRDDTGGLYDVAIAVHATSATTGTASMTINGDSYPFGNPNFTGIFSADMTSMQVFYGLMVIGTPSPQSVTLSDITVTDCTVDPEPFNGIFNVNLSDGEQYIGGAGWGGPVTVAVDGVEILTNVPMYSDDCSPGGTPRPLCFDVPSPEGFVFESGQHVVVSDGVNQKDLVLADVSITTIDVPTGRVTGTCSVGLDVRLTDLGETFDFACDDGTFERSFEPYLGWSSTVKAIQNDDDGDWTKVETAFFYDEDGSFDGFFSPVNNDEVNTAKAGRPIPVKWLLLDGDGVPVSHPASFFSITSSGAAYEGGEPTDAIEEYVGGSGLQYLGDGYWQFNWKTSKSYAGQCRTMTLTLLDGSELTASFMFK